MRTKLFSFAMFEDQNVNETHVLNIVDEFVLSSLDLSGDVALGLERPEKSSSRFGFTERAIKILVSINLFFHAEWMMKVDSLWLVTEILREYPCLHWISCKVELREQNAMTGR